MSDPSLSEAVLLTAPARVVFMGTPDFALPTLHRLMDSQRVVAVFTQPDRPAGRRRELRQSPVKEMALRANLPVMQPRTLRRGAEALAARAALEALRPDVLVVAAYGLILPQELLVVAPGGALNVHASLLPRWRGASPIQHSILAGDDVTGVTIMRMDEGLDTGSILATRSTPIGPREAAGELGMRLAQLGADLLDETLGPWLSGSVRPCPQFGSDATYAPQLHKSDGLLDFGRDAASLERQVRAYDPWPGAYFFGPDESRIKVLSSRVARRETDDAPGTLLMVTGELAVATAADALVLERVQPAGGRPMTGGELAHGRALWLGQTLADRATAGRP